MIWRILINLGLGLLLTACTGQANIARTSQDASVQAEETGAILTDIDQCRIALQAEPTTGTRRLDQSRMRLLSWNMQMVR